MQLGIPLSPCFRPELSSFKFLTSFEILALARGLAEAVKISDLYPLASKLDIRLKKDYTVSLSLEN